MNDLPTKEEAEYIVSSPAWDALDDCYVDMLTAVMRAIADGTLIQSVGEGEPE